jgi:hypothetical protein
MGAFRSTNARSQDVAVLDHTDPLSALGEGEWIKYRTVLGHRAATRMADAAAIPMIEKDQTIGVRLASGSVAAIKLAEGIVEWNLVDEKGAPAPQWDRAKADTLLEGLDPRTRSRLMALIDSEAPPALSTPNETDGTEGNASGENSASS